MKLKRVSGSKGKRWKKGQSCVSNPGYHHHREAAKGRFFQKLEGESGLTVEALAEHTAALAVESSGLKILCANSEDDQSLGRTFNTFATNFSTCTIPAFEKFFKNFNLQSDNDKRMLAIHAAAQEYIQEAGLPESSTSYLCALMISLESIKDSEDDVVATLSLMTRIMRNVSHDILKAKFGEYAKLLDDIFTHYAQTGNKNIIKNVIGCLSVILRAQNQEQWTYPYTMNLLHKILVYTIYEDKTVRHTAQYNVSAIIKCSSFMTLEDKEVEDRENADDLMENSSEELKIKKRDNSNVLSTVGPLLIHPGSKSVGKFVIANLKLASHNSNGKTTLYLLIFLQQMIMSLPQSCLELCCARVLSVMHIGDSTVNARALKVLHSLFSSKIGSTVLTSEIIEALINALTYSNEASSSKAAAPRSLMIIPNMNDVHLCNIWITTVTSGIVHLFQLNESAGMNHFTLWLSNLVNFWKSDSDLVHEKIFYTIEELLDVCIEPNVTALTSTYSVAILHAFQQVEKTLSLQYQPAWPYIFRTLAVFYKVIGPQLPAEMMKCLRNLSKMADDPQLPGRPLLELAIGSAIKAIGPEVVMKAVPLEITGDINEDEKHFWILPVLKKYVKNGSLCFFESYFVRLASKCYDVIDRLKENGKADSILSKSYQLIERQIWSLLPSFSIEAIDIEKAVCNTSFAIIIRDHIKLRGDTRLDIMAALRNMINSSKGNPGSLAKYSKNYLPVLFNVYLMKPRDKVPRSSEEITVDSGQRLAAQSTIQTYLQITPKPIIVELFNSIMNRYETAYSDPFQQRALLSLVRSFLPYLSPSVLSKFFLKVVRPGIQSKDRRMQKTAYRIIENILCVDSEDSNQFIRDHMKDLAKMIVNSFPSVAPNAKASRLKCIQLMLTHLPTKFESNVPLVKIVEEAVNCCGRKSSATTRKAAFFLIAQVGKTVQKLMNLSDEDTFLRCLELLPNLEPSSPSAPNTILALMTLSYQHKDLMPFHILEKHVEVISQLCKGQEDRDIIKSALSYMRIIFVIYPPAVLSNKVDTVVDCLISMNDSNCRKFRFKIRDIFASLIRKFGADRIKALVPVNANISKMLQNVIKTENRKKKSKKEKDVEQIDEEIKEVAPTSLDEILESLDMEIEDDFKPLKKTTHNSKSKKKQTWIHEDEEEIVDLLDYSSGCNINSKKPQSKYNFEKKVSETEEQKYGFRRDKRTNKFIITDKREDKPVIEKNKDEDFQVFEDVNKFITKKGEAGLSLERRKRTRSEMSDESAVDLVQQPTKYWYGATTADKGKESIKKFDYGAEYRSKKAGGDTTKKGGIAPYAYVQFSKESLNKRKKAKYAGQFKKLVKGAKKGASRAIKLKGKKK